VTVTWAAATGGGSVNPATSVTTASGHAQTTRTLGPNPGTQTTSASATDLTTVTFSITAQVGGATQMAINGGNSQTDTVGTTLPTPISVIVRDALNNPVPGVTVSWSVLTGLGSVGAPSSVTDGTGVASTSWTLGTRRTATDLNGVATGSLSSTRAETKTVSATVGGVAITQQPTVTVGPAVATNVSFVVQPPASTTAGATLTPAVQVEIRDQFNNRVTNAT